VPEESEETDKYNFALGGFRFGLAAGVGLEFNDNITSRSTTASPTSSSVPW